MIIWVHKSERMRNEDDPPSRFEKQADAFAILCAAKTQAKEGTVGVLAMAAGKGISVFVTPSYDKVLFGMNGQQIGDEANLTAAIWVPQFSLLNMDEDQILQQAQEMSIKDFTCGGLLEGVTDQAMSGMYEALDLRDGGSGYLGKGVLKAVSNVNSIIRPAIVGKIRISILKLHDFIDVDPTVQFEIDNFMVQQLDGTSNEWG